MAAKFNFNLRKAKSNSETPIHLIIRWQGNRIVYSSKETINPKYWAKNLQRAKATKEFPEYPEFNARLDWIESNAKNVFRKFLNDNENKLPQPEELKCLLDIKLRNAVEKEQKTFFEFAEQYIEESKTRFNSGTGKVLAKGTIKVYLNTIVNLKEFAAKKRKRVDFDTLDLNFYHEYVEYLSKEKNHCNNTVGRHIKTIKAILHEASERELNKNFAFKSKRFKKISEETEAIYLNEQELETIYNLDLTSSKRLEQVRDLFLIGCWTGLRFSDFNNIEPKNFKGEFLEIRTKKTDQTVVVPINKIVRSIMNKYRDQYENSLPPSISNPKINRYLKEIGKMINDFHVEIETTSSKGGVQKIIKRKKYNLIVSHTARRSFATNLYKDGLSSITIMKITGHKTERAFMRYIKVTPDENAKILQQHWQLKDKTKAETKINQT